jgi:hypothetical protein
MSGMSDSTTLATSDFVPIASLRDQTGIARSTLRRRLSRAGVPLFTDPTDERARLVRREDAEAFLRPRPAPDRPVTEATYGARTVRRPAA